MAKQHMQDGKASYADHEYHSRLAIARVVLVVLVVVGSGKVEIEHRVVDQAYTELLRLRKRTCGEPPSERQTVFPRFSPYP